MDPFVPIAIVAVSTGLAVLLWLAFGGATAAQKLAVANLRRQLPAAAAAGSSGRPEGGRLAGRLRHRLPAGMIHNLQQLRVGAGRPERWPLDRLLVVKFLLGLLGVALIALAAAVNRTPLGLMLGLGVAVLLFFLPELRLYSRGIERRAAISLELPDMLDQMSIAVSAGLGFDAAMVRVSKNSKGILAAEMVRTMQDIQVGQTRRVAYQDLAGRTGVPTVRRFVRAIIQAEAYGISLSEVLHTQADELRIERRQLAERKAQEIPVKVVFPLVLCILPAMFVVVIGPGAIQIIQGFGGAF